MEQGRKTGITELNSHDRKILAKYTGFYTNFIESNTARPDENKDDSYKIKH